MLENGRVVIFVCFNIFSNSQLFIPIQTMQCFTP